jgi:hypothetical protein
VPLLSVLLAVLSFGIPYPADFPDPLYPASFVTRHAGLIRGARLFTTDAWGDYLTYRFYPVQRVFIDGRSDFFGEQFSEDYQLVLNGQRGWEKVLDQTRVETVLAPENSAIASLLRDRSDWKLVDDDGVAALYTHVSR